MAHAATGAQEGDSGCPLARAADKFEQLVDRGGHREAEEFLTANLPAVWFGGTPSRHTELVKTLMENSVSPSPILEAQQRIFGTSTAEDIFTGKALGDIEAKNPQLRPELIVVRMGALRLQGYTRKAWELAQEALRNIPTMQPLYDTSNGRDLHVTVQAGAVAMMVGEFQEALRLFAQAQLQVVAPGFDFLRRDALIRSAMIHASYGDPAAAQGMLARADREPRTGSWVEEQLDAQHMLVNVLVHTDPQLAWETLERIDRHQLGELWPFYVIALERVMRAGGYRNELERRLVEYDSMPLARVDGDGVCGSVLPLNRALFAMDSGLHEQAQEFLKRADPKLHLTELFTAAQYLHAGRSAKAYKTAEGLRESVRGLRLMDIRRLAIIAAAEHQRGDSDGALAAAKQAMALSRPLSLAETRQFSPQVRQLASSHIEGWHDDAALPSLFLNSLADAGYSLSVRELEIIKHLARGESRAQMAKELFISLNTLKSQLRSIFRKLQVSSAAEALREADRRGLL